MSSANRKHDRYIYEADVEIKFDSGDVHPGKLTNFSLGGAYIQLQPLPKFGSKIKLGMNLPGVPERSEILCFVRWVNDGQGMGVQFEYVRPIEIWAMTKLIKKLKKIE